MNRSEILDTAKQAVTVDRAATHGDAEQTFSAIAEVWSARLGQTLTPAQVAILLSDLKTCRAWGNPAHADNWVDMAGYAACGGEIATGAAPEPVLTLEPPFVAPDPATKESTKEPAPVTKAPPHNPTRATQRAKFAPGPKWSDEELETAKDMTARGFTIAEVAEKLGRPEHGTRKKLLQFSDEIKARAEAHLAAREEPAPVVAKAEQSKPDQELAPAIVAPCHGFTAEMDARLRGLMARDVNIAGAASIMRVPRDKVAARWAQIAHTAPNSAADGRNSDFAGVAPSTTPKATQRAGK